MLYVISTAIYIQSGDNFKITKGQINLFKKNVKKKSRLGLYFIDNNLYPFYLFTFMCQPKDYFLIVQFCIATLKHYDFAHPIMEKNYIDL